jgi:replicative DNA helicase
MKLTDKIYFTQNTYETTLILGMMTKLYYRVTDDLPPEEYVLIKDIFTKISNKHIKNRQIQACAKALKICLAGDLEINYENLVEASPEFKKICKDKDSFTNIVAKQLFPSYEDILLFQEGISHNSDSGKSILELFYDNPSEFKNPELTELVGKIKDIKSKLDGDSAETYEYKSGQDLVDLYEIEEKLRDAGKGFYSCGFAAIDKYLNEGLAPKKITVIGGRTGMGKCHGKGTLVMKYDGELEAVENIKLGDLLMGPDSKPRTVISTTVGMGDLYRVHQNGGDSYVVNAEHVLSLRNVLGDDTIPKGGIQNIPVSEFANGDSAYRKKFRGYKAGIDFPEVELKAKPYVLGTRLGLLSNFDLFEGYPIPKKYIINSRKNRLELLAGLIDSEGYPIKNVGYEILHGNINIVKQIKFMADTLGFRTRLVTRIPATLKDQNIQKKYRVHIYGDISSIPSLKYSQEVKQSSAVKEYASTNIRVIPIGVGDFYGFELDSDHLYLLQDCTVTHNSALAMCLMKNLSAKKVHVAENVIEMNTLSYLDRYVAATSLIDIKKLIKERSTLTESEKFQIQLTKERIAAHPYLHLNDKPAPTIDAIRTEIIKLQKKIGQKYVVVFIDLFDKVKNVQERRSNMQDNFHTALNEILTLAKELDVHFVLVSQISRDSEKRTAGNNRPKISELKHSGMWEEIADVIILVDRPAYRMMEDESEKMSEEIAPERISSGFDYESVESFHEKYNSDIFSKITLSVKEDKKKKDGGKEKEEDSLENALKESHLVKVGNIVIPISQYAEIILAKQRSGEMNKIIPFIYKGEYSLFTSVSLVSPVN